MICWRKNDPLGHSKDRRGQVWPVDPKGSEAYHMFAAGMLLETHAVLFCLSCGTTLGCVCSGSCLADFLARTFTTISCLCMNAALFTWSLSFSHCAQCRFALEIDLSASIKDFGCCC